MSRKRPVRLKCGLKREFSEKVESKVGSMKRQIQKKFQSKGEFIRPFHEKVESRVFEIKRWD